jgi:hypothetical protein
MFSLPARLQKSVAITAWSFCSNEFIYFLSVSMSPKIAQRRENILSLSLWTTSKCYQDVICSLSARDFNRSRYYHSMFPLFKWAQVYKVNRHVFSVLTSPKSPTGSRDVLSLCIDDVKILYHNEPYFLRLNLQSREAQRFMVSLCSYKFKMYCWLLDVFFLSRASKIPESNSLCCLSVSSFKLHSASSRVLSLSQPLKYENIKLYVFSNWRTSKLSLTLICSLSVSVLKLHTTNFYVFSAQKHQNMNIV